MTGRQTGAGPPASQLRARDPCAKNRNKHAPEFNWGRSKEERLRGRKQARGPPSNKTANAETVKEFGGEPGSSKAGPLA